MSAGSSYFESGDDDLWTRYDYDDGETAWQRECPHCDKGLLLAPARFCRRCGGSGFLVVWQKERPSAGSSAVGSAQPNPDGESSGGLGVPG